MIVEDNDLMRRQIVQLVTKENDIIFECNNGECAIINYKEFYPDWILMDIQMPGINGIFAAEKIKELNPEAHIAFVTSFDDFSYRRKAKSIGIDYYFLKSDLLSIRQTLENYKYSKRGLI